MQYDYSRNKTENPDPIKAEIKGTLPDWLQGTLVRNGPGMFSVGETSYNHWFDGMALLHSFTIKDGDVFFRSRYLRGDTYKSNMEAKRIVVSEMGTMAYPDPSNSLISKAIKFLSHTVPDFTDNCGNNIIKYGDDFYATSETNYIRKIDPETLETQDKVDYLKYIAVNLVTSHPHYDKDGSTYNMGTTIAEKGKTRYTIFRVPPAEEDSDKKKPVLKSLEVICSVPCRSLLSPSYYHSFGITDNYIIFLEQPLKLDILKMATAYMRGVNWASCLNFQPEDNTQIHLIDRKTCKPVSTKFFTNALVVYHHVNAYEDDGHLVVDVIAYKDNSLYEMFYLASLQPNSSSGEAKGKLTSKPNYERFVLPLQSDKEAEIGNDLVKLKSTSATALKEKEGKLFCFPETLFKGAELPRINYNFNGKKHRYVYVTCVEQSPVPLKIMKLDIETKQQLYWGEDDCWPSEPVFIPAPNAVEEDDGVVLTVVVRPYPEKSSFLLVLDARSFKEVARACVTADLHIDMHGFFIPRRT
ncbi:beta,beta-carotene 15,15'-dioxygenase [Amia ocellicauda]|uniref:beta,beta-carotene 15,15'-dioxygenase n=1 Tax=Amia ocellicauda TaxID=2972642 RepID=UPI00346490B2